MICYAIGICACFTLRIYLMAQNKLRDRRSAAEQGGVADGEQEVGAFEDRTDKEEGSFRYVY